jgi:hypothetical protein
MLRRILLILSVVGLVCSLGLWAVSYLLNLSVGWDEAGVGLAQGALWLEAGPPQHWGRFLPPGIFCGGYRGLDTQWMPQFDLNGNWFVILPGLDSDSSLCPVVVLLCCPSMGWSPSSWSVPPLWLRPSRLTGGLP